MCARLAQATLNVMVATFSLFTTGWGLTMLVITFFINRRPQGKPFGFRLN